MEAPMNPNRRRVYKEEVVYEPIPQSAQPVYEQVVQPVQPVYEQVVQQPVYEQVVQQPVQPVYQQVVQPVVEAGPTVDDRRSYSQLGRAKVENIQQSYYDANGNLMDREEQVFDDPYARRLNVLDRTSQIIYFVMGVVEFLLALRFLFRVLNADAQSGFVNFVYNLTRPFVGPFAGVFNDQVVNQTSVVEFSTLLAMALYAVLTYGIVQLLYLLFTPNRNTRQVFSTTRRRRY